jgi:hypothetical protein
MQAVGLTCSFLLPLGDLWAMAKALSKYGIPTTKYTPLEAFVG